MFKAIAQLLMQRLFWKIFLWFWLAMIVLICSVSATLIASMDPDKLQNERLHFLSILERSAHRIVRLSYRPMQHARIINPSLQDPAHFGAPGKKTKPIDIAIQLRPLKKIDPQRLQKQLPMLLERINTHRNIQHFLFNAQGEALAPAPEALTAFFKRQLESGKRSISNHQDRLFLGPQPLQIGQDTYYLVMDMESPWLLTRLFYASRTQTVAITTAVLVSALFSMLMALSIIRPLRSLRRTARRLAGGALQSRVSPNLLKRKDEIGEFGRDFERMAEKMETMVGAQQRLLRDVSHELRSPLTRLQIASAIARKKSQGHADGEHSRIEREIERLDALISQVIQWSRLETTYTLDKEDCDLAGLLEIIVEDCDFEAQASGLSVLLKSEPNIHLQASIQALGSAVENIIRNALRFAPTGSSVNVTAQLSMDKQKVRIYIEDCGCGVPEEVLGEMFEPFFRVDDTRGAENSGSGLGTAIARQAIELHQGRIWAENTQPGLRVTIEIPLLS